MAYSVVKHRSGKGYALHYSGTRKPTWIKGDTFAWYRRKRDAVSGANVLNQADQNA